jgi:hypothetical protein
MQKKLIFMLGIILMLGSCKKSDSDEGNLSAGTWDLNVKTSAGDTFVLAKGTFSFTATAFTVHVVTSKIGGGDIVKEFDMSGSRSGDSIFLQNYVLNLTDPVEVVTVNGRIWVGSTSMNGFGDYSIVQPPDTQTYEDDFLVTATKN